MIKPPRLKPGDKVATVSPSSVQAIISVAHAQPTLQTPPFLHPTITLFCLLRGLDNGANLRASVSVHVLSLRGATAVLNAVKEAIPKSHEKVGDCFGLRPRNDRQGELLPPFQRIPAYA